MLLQLLLLVIGLALLVMGGESLVRGASSLARSLGVPAVVIGLTVVAFGTSAPELAVNASAAIYRQTDLSFGNIIGSNIANIGLIIGIAALIKPLYIHRSIITREIPMMLLASLVAFANAFDVRLDSAGRNVYSRTDAITLLLLFGVFLYYTTSELLSPRGGESDGVLSEFTEIVEEEKAYPLWLSTVLVLLGLAALLGGGKLTVDAASTIATALGVPQVIIGLSIIAVGTSLPELATSLIAIFRGKTDIAVGNVVGSNIFNLLLVQGVSSLIYPTPIPAGGHMDLVVMLALSVVLLPLAITHQRRIVRTEGAFLLIAYVGYMAWRYGTTASVVAG